MIAGLNIEGIDWSNPDVNKLVDILGEKFKQISHERDSLRKEVVKLKDDYSNLKDENLQLKGEVEALTKKIEGIVGRKPRGKRSKSGKYSTRKYKGYPQPEDTSKKQSAYAVKQEGHGTIFEDVDCGFCPACGESLSEPCDEYIRNNCEDIINGKWYNVRLRIIGRYCKKCRTTRHAKSPNFLPSEQLGITILTLIYSMRHLTVSYGKIVNLFSIDHIHNHNLWIHFYA